MRLESWHIHFFSIAERWGNWRRRVWKCLRQTILMLSGINCYRSVLSTEKQLKFSILLFQHFLFSHFLPIHHPFNGVSSHKCVCLTRRKLFFSHFSLSNNWKSIFQMGGWQEKGLFFSPHSQKLWWGMFFFGGGENNLVFILIEIISEHNRQLHNIC